MYWYLAVTTLFTLVSALTGFVLSTEGATKGDMILIHQWFGVFVSLLLVVWFYLFDRIKSGSIVALQGAMVIAVVVTGHYGGMITHGAEFLSLNREVSSEATQVLPDNPNVFTHLVQPILDRKCVSCHNENKSKGSLLMTGYDVIAKGGEGGSALDNATGILHRVQLPMEDEAHMPPPEENQLTSKEIMILESWLLAGGSNDQFYSDLSTDEPLHGVISAMIEASKTSAWIDLPEVSDSDIADMESEYCTVRRMYQGSNALQVLVFPHQSFDASELKRLKEVGENIVELNLSNLPLDANAVEQINSFVNLELLDLNGSAIDDVAFESLQELQKLRSLKIYNTSLSDASTPKISSFPVLQQLYVYQTAISEEGKSSIQAQASNVNIISYAEEADQFKSVLPAPMLEPVRYFFREPFYVTLEHPLDQIDLKYTLDGSDPTEGSVNFDDSLLIDDNFTFKYYAQKDGWESSPIDSVEFFQTISEPVDYQLTFEADQRYLGIGKELLFDLEKGSNNFGDDAWMAFREHPFELTCELAEATELSKVTLSSMVHTDPYIFPPVRIAVYGGSDEANLKLLKEYRPPRLKERADRHFKYYTIEFDATTCKYVKLVVEPNQKLPIWHRGKGEKGWFFIDEVLLASSR